MKSNKIYSDCYQLSIHIFGRTKAFPKYYRPSIGSRIESAVLECLLNIRKANTSKGSRKINFLYQASNHLDDLRTLVALSKDMHILNIAGFSEVLELTKVVGKEIGGLIKYEQSRASKPTS